jgi:hypothetical protein
MFRFLFGGLAVILVLCFAISEGHAWGALMFQLVGAAWILYCFTKY